MMLYNWNLFIYMLLLGNRKPGRLWGQAFESSQVLLRALSLCPSAFLLACEISVGHCTLSFSALGAVLG